MVKALLGVVGYSKLGRQGCGLTCAQGGCCGFEWRAGLSFLSEGVAVFACVGGVLLRIGYGSPRGGV